MNNSLFLLFAIVINFALWLIFLRFMVQLAEVDKKHPYVKVLYRLTAAVDIFARIFPTLGKGKLSTAALVLMFLLWLIRIAGKILLLGKHLTALSLFFIGSITALIMFLKALQWTIIVAVVLSFVVMLSQRIHPVIEIIMQLADPLIAPFRKITPDLGMLDLSPLIAMLALSLTSSVVELFAKEVWRYFG